MTTPPEDTAGDELSVAVYTGPTLDVDVAPPAEQPHPPTPAAVGDDDGGAVLTPEQEAALAAAGALPATLDEVTGADFAAAAVDEIILSARSVDELEAIEKRLIDQLGLEGYAERVNTPGTYERTIYLAKRDWSAEAQRRQDALAKVAKPEQLAAVLRNGERQIILGPASPRPRDRGANTLVSGDAALFEFASYVNGGTKRFPLYNTGIMLEVAEPTNEQLHTLIANASADAAIYGREFGMHFYTYSDLLLKEAMADFLRKVVIGSNLRNWNHGNNLFERMSLHDFDVAFWALTTLMYPQGYPDFVHACDKCNDVQKITADLTKMIRHDFGMLSPACITTLVGAMSRDGEADGETVAKYQRDLIPDEEIRFKHWGFTLRVPTVAQYLAAGRRFNAMLHNDVASEQREDIYSAITFRFPRTFAPWITKVTAYKADGAAGVTSQDPAVIERQLDQLQRHDRESTVVNQLLDFVNRSRVSHVCYPVHKCPACGHTPETKTGFYTLDTQRAFFTLAMRTLITAD